MKKMIGIILCLSSFCFAEKFRQGIAPYGTHFPVLASVVANTTGPILELGCGDYSTPMLHALCAPTQRQLASTDVSKEWLTLFVDLERNWHLFFYVPAYEPCDERCNILYAPNQDVWNTLLLETVHWSIVLVDHSPGSRRPIEIERLRKNTDIFVVHDTEDDRYGYEPLLSSFKYKYVYERYHVLTTVVSDTIDINKFIEA